MLLRASLWAIRRYVKGPGRSWLYTMAATLLWRQVQNRRGRTQLIDTQSLSPGTRLAIEHLPISHRQQIKDLKKAEGAAKAEQRATAKAERRAAKQAKAAARRHRRQRRRDRRRAVARWGVTRLERRLVNSRGGTSFESHSAQPVENDLG